jgi:hypothetical protein
MGCYRCFPYFDLFSAVLFFFFSTEVLLAGLGLRIGNEILRLFSSVEELRIRDRGWLLVVSTLISTVLVGAVAVRRLLG